MIQKKCKCSDTCTKYPTMSFGGYFYAHAPEKIKEEQGLKAKKGYQRKLDRQKSSVLSRKLHVAANVSENEKSSNLAPEIKLRSQNLADADKVFGDWIKKRDKNDENKVKCPCCGKWFELGSKTIDGEQIVNVLHFVGRNVYSLRYSENNCFAGDNICNLAMHLKPHGKQYQNYKKFLVARLGEEEVARMENARRNINKFSASDIRDIITKYSTK